MQCFAAEACDESTMCHFDSSRFDFKSNSWGLADEQLLGEMGRAGWGTGQGWIKLVTEKTKRTKTATNWSHRVSSCRGVELKSLIDANSTMDGILLQPLKWWQVGIAHTCYVAWKKVADDAVLEWYGMGQQRLTYYDCGMEFMAQNMYIWHHLTSYDPFVFSMVLRGFSAKALDGVISSGPWSTGCIGCLSLNMGRPCGNEVIPRHGKENVKLAVEKSTAQKMPNLGRD